MKKLLLVLPFVAMSYVMPALAQEDFMSRIPPEGSVILNLSASEREDVAQDMLTATLRYEVKDTNPKSIQGKINAKMGDAIAIAKTFDTVKTSTGSYNVSEYYLPVKKDEARKKAWRGQQTVMLKSKDTKAMLDLVTKMQEMGLAMSNMSYMVSPDKAQIVNDELLTSALKKLQQRAKTAAAALGKKSVQFLEINADGGGYMPRPQPMMRMDMAMAESAPMKQAVAEPGESEMTMSVNARILLKD